jgi:hypothetical protein
MFVRNDVARVGLGDHGRKVIGLKYVQARFNPSRPVTRIELRRTSSQLV